MKDPIWISAVLIHTFSPNYLKVTNESIQHKGHTHAGEYTHFRITLVSDTFTGIPPVNQHRMVYTALEPAFKEGLHALALHTFSPEEKK